jgi:hypothetical protein
MKIPKLLPFACILAGPLSGPCSAAVLFTDNFTVDANINDPNYQFNSPGRQGGSLATLTYTPRFLDLGSQEQVGNESTFPGNPDALLLAFGGGARIDFDFATIPSAIEIRFDGTLSNGASGDASNWISLNIGRLDQDNFVTTGAFGLLFRANGETQYFDHSGSGVAGVSGANLGFNVFTDYRVVLSDAAGTGSAFGTNGSKVSYYQGGNLLDTLTIGQLDLASGRIGLGAISIGGIDNLQVSAIPEPSVAGLAGLAGLLALRRRRR